MIILPIFDTRRAFSRVLLRSAPILQATFDIIDAASRYRRQRQFFAAAAIKAFRNQVQTIESLCPACWK
jgi:hypothetical protein